MYKNINYYCIIAFEKKNFARNFIFNSLTHTQRIFLFICSYPSLYRILEKTNPYYAKVAKVDENTHSNQCLSHRWTASVLKADPLRSERVAASHRTRCGRATFPPLMPSIKLYISLWLFMAKTLRDRILYTAQPRFLRCAFAAS